jgi:hypothetical protein
MKASKEKKISPPTNTTMIIFQKKIYIKFRWKKSIFSHEYSKDLRIVVIK